MNLYKRSVIEDLVKEQGLKSSLVKPKLLKYLMSRLKKDINFRIIGVYLFTVFISLIIIFKIVQVQYFNNEINTSSQPRYFIEHATRGNIFLTTVLC